MVEDSDDEMTEEVVEQIDGDDQSVKESDEEEVS